MAHKPSMSKSPEQSKTLPSHAFRAASAAERDSNVIKLPSPKYYRSHEDAAPIQQLAHELAKRDLSDANFSTGGVSRSDLTRIATLSMARKQASDQAEQEKVDARKRRSEEEAQSEYSNHQDLDNAARRIVAERIARVTLTGEEGDEVLAGKAAGESINRGNERVRDWERVLKSIEDENKSDKEQNMGWLRQSMRRSAPIEAIRNDPSVIMAAAQRNVNSRLDQMDRTIAQEQMLLGRASGENLARGDTATKDLERRGTADLEHKHKERASNFLFYHKTDIGTYDIGGMIMTYEQVEAIAQKNVDEVLAEINEKVQREKERIETERIERETKLREKQHEKDLARERAAEEKAEKDRIKSEQREQKAEEKRIKTETKLAEKKKKEDEKIAQKELKAVQKEQLAVGEGVDQYDAQKDPEAELTHRQEEAAKHRALDEAQGDQVGAVNGLLEFGAQKDQEEFRKNVEDKTHVGRELAEIQEDQRASVGGVLGFDTQNDQEAYRKLFQKKPQTDGELAEVQEDQAASAGSPLEYNAQKDQEAYHKRFEEKQAAGSELAEAQDEQSRVAEVLHPDTTSDDEAKGKGIKSWLKEKKDKIGKRLGRHISPESPTKLESKEPEEEEEEEEEEEDLYGEQLPMTSNWREAPHTREDSLRNIALAKHEHLDVAGGKMEEREPVEQASAQHEVEHTEESGDEEFNDAEENFEPKEPAGTSLAVKEEPRKLSSERGSRFKEEF